jgi:hypothetical protein
LTGFDNSAAFLPLLNVLLTPNCVVVCETAPVSQNTSAILECVILFRIVALFRVSVPGQ